MALKNTLSERETFEEVRNVLLQINYGSNEITIDEKIELYAIISNATKYKNTITVTLSEDVSLGSGLSIMVIAY